MSSFYTVSIRFHPHLSRLASNVEVVREDGRDISNSPRERAAAKRMALMVLQAHVAVDEKKGA